MIQKKITPTEMLEWLQKHPNALPCDTYPYIGYCDGEDVMLCRLKEAANCGELYRYRADKLTEAKIKGALFELGQAYKEAVACGVAIDFTKEWFDKISNENPTS